VWKDRTVACDFMRVCVCVCACSQNDDIISQTAHEQIIVALTPLLENNHPTQEICSFFTKVLLRGMRGKVKVNVDLYSTLL